MRSFLAWLVVMLSAGTLALGGLAALALDAARHRWNSRTRYRPGWWRGHAGCCAITIRAHTGARSGSQRRDGGQRSRRIDQLRHQPPLRGTLAADARQGPGEAAGQPALARRPCHPATSAATSTWASGSPRLIKAASSPGRRTLGDCPYQRPARCALPAAAATRRLR